MDARTGKKRTEWVLENPAYEGASVRRTGRTERIAINGRTGDCRVSECALQERMERTIPGTVKAHAGNKRRNGIIRVHSYLSGVLQLQNSLVVGGAQQRE